MRGYQDRCESLEFTPKAQWNPLGNDPSGFESGRPAIPACHKTEGTGQARIYPRILAGLLLFAFGCVSRPPQAGDSHDSLPRTEAGAYPATTENLPQTLRDCLARAFRANPGLRAAFERWQAAMERISQARSLDDPTLSFEVFLDQVDTRYQMSLTQMFPAPGMLRLRRDRTTAEARAALHALEAQRLSLYLRVATGFHEYHYLARATVITKENLQFLTELEQAVKSRYRTGEAAFADLIKVQVEKERLSDREAALHEQRRVLSTELATLLNLSPQTLLPWPQPAPPEKFSVDEETLAGVMNRGNPEIKAADAQIEAQEMGEELARRNGWPRFMLGAGAMVMNGMDGSGNETDIGLMAGITLPIWRGRVRAARDEAAALRRSAQQECNHLRNRLRAELSMAVFKFRDAERRVGLFDRSLVPKAEQALEVARQAYAGGQVGFMAMIDAQRTLLDLQLMADRAIADREIALANIRRGVGKEMLNSSDRTDPVDSPADKETRP